MRGAREQAVAAGAVVESLGAQEGHARSIEIVDGEPVEVGDQHHPDAVRQQRVDDVGGDEGALQLVGRRERLFISTRSPARQRSTIRLIRSSSSASLPAPGASCSALRKWLCKDPVRGADR